MKVFFLNEQHVRMAQRLVRLPLKSKIASTNLTFILFFPFNVSKLLSSLSKYIKADLMNLLLEENASLDNVLEKLSTLMTVLQTLRTVIFTYIPVHIDQRPTVEMHRWTIRTNNIPMEREMPEFS